jgi:hypothetical protein
MYFVSKNIFAEEKPWTSKSLTVTMLSAIASSFLLCSSVKREYGSRGAGSGSGVLGMVINAFKASVNEMPASLDFQNLELLGLFCSEVGQMYLPLLR